MSFLSTLTNEDLLCMILPTPLPNIDDPIVITAPFEQLSPTLTLAF
jgi:hypothetical protein